MKALIADDEKLSRKTLVFYMERLGYDVLQAENGQEALRLWRSESPRIVLTDWNMPEMDGAELCRTIRREDNGYTYLIMITAREGTADLMAGFQAGVDDYLTKPVLKDEIDARLKAAERIFSLRDKEMVIFSLAKLTETRDPETGYHLERIQGYAKRLAEALLARRPEDFPEVTRPFIESIYLTSPLHDIGKVGVPDRILLKPGPLTQDEFAVMKTHTHLGYETLASAHRRNPHAIYLRMSAEIARSHHERWDGSGYPDGLSGNDIPLSARIVAIADVYDALISKRIYKEAFSHQVAREIISEESGKHFDPVLVDAFLEVEADIVEIAHRFRV